MKDEERPEPGEDLETFLGRLARVSSYRGAAHLANAAPAGATPAQRRWHTNLIWYLSAFRVVVGGRLLVLDRPDCMPQTATSEERAAYAALADRLVEAGELSREDAAHVHEQAANPHPPARVPERRTPQTCEQCGDRLLLLSVDERGGRVRLSFRCARCGHDQSITREAGPLRRTDRAAS